MNTLKLKPTTNQTRKGFTIIEVVLVLAIAGLIFLMVFIALPALQRNQRDTQRKNDLSRVQTALLNYRTNNKGNLPESGSVLRGPFTDQYLKIDGSTFQDPDGSTYQFAYLGSYESIPHKNTNGTTPIYLYRGAKCGPDEAVTFSQGSQKFAIMMKLEGGGVYCIDG